MNKEIGINLQPGHIVQINPETVLNKAFSNCLMVVTEVKDWGIQGYVQALGKTRDEHGGQAYYRAKWEEFEYCGQAFWILAD